MSQFQNMTARKALGTRGKYAEDKVRDQLSKWSSEQAGFDFERNYDGRSSMGRIPARPGDYTYFGIGENRDHMVAPYHGVIEVKQVAHDFRLPRKNFDPAKFGILRKREMAGGKVAVIVYHSTTKKWRCPPFGWFVSLAERASWDLTPWPQYATVEEVLHAAELF